MIGAVCLWNGNRLRGRWNIWRQKVESVLYPVYILLVGVLYSWAVAYPFRR